MDEYEFLAALKKLAIELEDLRDSVTVGCATMERNLSAMHAALAISRTRMDRLTGQDVRLGIGQG
jgi:hypothetical protein